MDHPPANPNDDLHWFHYFQQENPLPWEDQTMEELDDYLEMLNHDPNSDHQLRFQDFDPSGDLSLWDNWCDVVTDDHDSINVTSDRQPNLLSSASATDIIIHGGGRRWDDDLAPFLSCNEYDDKTSYVISDRDCHAHQDNNSTPVTAVEHGGRKLLWDDSFPLLISCNDDEDTSAGNLVKPMDTDVTNSEAANSDGGGRKRGGRRCVPALELEEIEKLFEMPIVMAAKELNVGLTVLKKRCRELNIKRWPHRKLKSIKSLIQNVKEMGLKEEMEMLEENKRMMEKAPEMQLTPRTKKLRQACFKFNYKKRKLLISNLESPHYPNYPFN